MFQAINSEATVHGYPIPIIFPCKLICQYHPQMIYQEQLPLSQSLVRKLTHDTAGAKFPSKVPPTYSTEVEDLTSVWFSQGHDTIWAEPRPSSVYVSEKRIYTTSPLSSQTPLGF